MVFMDGKWVPKDSVQATQAQKQAAKSVQPTHPRPTEATDGEEFNPGPVIIGLAVMAVVIGGGTLSVVSYWNEQPKNSAATPIPGRPTENAPAHILMVTNTPVAASQPGEPYTLYYDGNGWCSLYDKNDTEHAQKHGSYPVNTDVFMSNGTSVQCTEKSGR